MTETINLSRNSVHQTSRELCSGFQGFIRMSKKITQTCCLIPPILKNIYGTAPRFIDTEVRPLNNIFYTCRDGIIPTTDSLIGEHQKPVTQGAKGIFSLLFTQILTIDLPRKFDHPAFNLLIQGIVEFL